MCHLRRLETNHKDGLGEDSAPHSWKISVAMDRAFLIVVMYIFVHTFGGSFSFAETVLDAQLREDKWNAIPTLETPSSASLSFSPVSSDGGEDALNERGDPHHLNYTWMMPDPATQLERDAKLRPVMSGGIFVPSMTGGVNEPKVQIFSEEGKIVKESYTGTSAFLPAGRYRVQVGTPMTFDRLEFDVNVVEGSTTMVPVEWSGIVVKVVNDRGGMVRGNYEIVRLPERSYIGLGAGALVNEGERLTTWLLWPGQYMIISVGEGYQARKNFITVDVEPGELSRVTLVIDEETGDILGGGEIDSPVDDVEDRWWWAGVMVGGSVRFNHTKDVVGKASGQLLDVSAFLDTSFTLGLKQHFIYMRLNAEIGGTIRFEDRPFVTTIDELGFDLLYTYRVVDWFGPYVRFAFESNMAPAYQELTTPHDVVWNDKQGSIRAHSEDKNEVKLSPSFSPIKLNTGTGARFDYTFGSWMKLSSRIGIAYLHVFARDLYVIGEIDNTQNIVTLEPVEEYYRFGAEAALTLDVTPIRWLSFKVDTSVIEPFEDYRNPIVVLDLDAAVRLSSIASISYSLRLNYDVSLIDKVQIDQYVQLRFSYKIY